MDNQDKNKQGEDKNKDATKVMDEKKEKEMSEHDKKADKIGNFEQ
ncbi:MAG: hypothetical protein V4474_00625 [Patescibacteria group bacterium]